VEVILIDFEARRADTYAAPIGSAPSALNFHQFMIHALTGMAIECRPFGPKIARI